MFYTVTMKCKICCYIHWTHWTCKKNQHFNFLIKKYLKESYLLIWNNGSFFFFNCVTLSNILQHLFYMRIFIIIKIVIKYHDVQYLNPQDIIKWERWILHWKFQLIFLNVKWKRKNCFEAKRSKSQLRILNYLLLCAVKMILIFKKVLILVLIFPRLIPWWEWNCFVVLWNETLIFLFITA